MQPSGPRFLHVPQTEQEVVCLFVALMDDIDDLEKPLIIERMQTAFPDCTVRVGERQVRIEFELYGSNFDHPFDGVVLVCWRDDRNDWPAGFRVIELAEVVEDKKQSGLFVNLQEGYPAPWNEDSFFAAADRDGTDGRDMALARRIIEFARQNKWGPVWLVNPKPVFAVGSPQFFKVDSRGRIGFPFSRLRARGMFTELASRLNRVIPSLLLEATDATTKSKGGQLSALFRSEQQLSEFFEVWSWFKSNYRRDA
jgi:hypothetical protein